MTIAAIATAVMVVATWRLIAPPRVGLLQTCVGLLKLESACSNASITLIRGIRGVFAAWLGFLGDFVTKPCAQLATAAQTSAAHLNGPSRTASRGVRVPRPRF